MTNTHQRGAATGRAPSLILSAARAHVPPLPAWRCTDRCLQTLRSRAHHLLLANPPVARRHRACPTETTFWILPIPRGPAILVTAPTQSAHKSTQLLSSVHCVQSASQELTICVRICAPTPMSVLSCAAFVARHLLVSTIGNDTRACTQARRSLSAVAISRKMATGVVVGDSRVQMLLVVTSGPKPAASAYVPCLKRRRKKRVAGMASNNRRSPMVTACSTPSHRTLAA